MLLNQLTFCELKLKHAELDQFKLIYILLQHFYLMPGVFKAFLPGKCSDHSSF